MSTPFFREQEQKEKTVFSFHYFWEAMLSLPKTAWVSES
jgi:hypothetical protein